MALTNEDVDRLEKTIRDAQALVEEAGRIVCGERGEVPGRIWGRLTQLASDVGSVVHDTWMLRPEPGDAEAEP